MSGLDWPGVCGDRQRRSRGSVGVGLVGDLRGRTLVSSKLASDFWSLVMVWGIRGVWEAARHGCGVWPAKRGLAGFAVFCEFMESGRCAWGAVRLHVDMENVAVQIWPADFAIAWQKMRTPRGRKGLQAPFHPA